MKWGKGPKGPKNEDLKNQKISPGVNPICAMVPNLMPLIGYKPMLLFAILTIISCKKSMQNHLK